jgi:hypothetical protein
MNAAHDLTALLSASGGYDAMRLVRAADRAIGLLLFSSAARPAGVAASTNHREPS